MRWMCSAFIWRRARMRRMCRARILDGFAHERRLFVLANKEVRSYVFKVTDQWFGMTYLQLFVAVLVAILGIVNTLTVSITDRRRELGVLRAVGGLRNQIRHTIWMEALAIGIVGLVLGVAAGAVNLYYMLTVSRENFAGIALDYTFPYGIVGLLVPVILGAAFGVGAVSRGERGAEFVSGGAGV